MHQSNWQSLIIETWKIQNNIVLDVMRRVSNFKILHYQINDRHNPSTNCM